VCYASFGYICLCFGVPQNVGKSTISVSPVSEKNAPERVSVFPIQGAINHRDVLNLLNWYSQFC